MGFAPTLPEEFRAGPARNCRQVDGKLDSPHVWWSEKASKRKLGPAQLQTFEVYTSGTLVKGLESVQDILEANKLS